MIFSSRILVLLAIVMSPALLWAADDPEVETLFEQLSAEEFKTRETARKSLIDRGDDAIPQIKALAEKNQDPETRSAVAAILKEIEARGINGPTLITLDVKDAAPKDVIDEIARQARIELKPWPDEMWKFLEKNRKVTISVKRQPFWSVMKQVLPQAGLQLTTQGAQSQMRLSRGIMSEMDGPASQTGPFMVVVNSVSDNRTIRYDQPGGAFSSGTYLSGNVFVGPKVKILSRSYQPIVEEFEDDAGHSLMTREREFVPGVSGQRDPIFTFRINVPNIEGRTKKIRNLKGYFRVVLMTRSDRIEIPQITRAKGTSQTKGFWTIKVNDVTAEGSGNVSLNLTFLNNESHDKDTRPEWKRNIGFESLTLMDAEGRALDKQGHSMGGNGQKWDGKFQFRSGQGIGEPAKLVWEFPAEAEEARIPFEFKDLPLP